MYKGNQTLTGAVGFIKSDDFEKISTPNVANALQGRVSGVFISASGARVALRRAFVVSVLLTIAIRSCG